MLGHDVMKRLMKLVNGELTLRSRRIAGEKNKYRFYSSRRNFSNSEDEVSIADASKTSNSVTTLHLSSFPVPPPTYPHASMRRTHNEDILTDFYSLDLQNNAKLPTRSPAFVAVLWLASHSISTSSLFVPSSTLRIPSFK